MKMIDNFSPFDRNILSDMIERWLGPTPSARLFSVFTDTSDFFEVEYGDVILLKEHPYLIRNTEREGRFSIDDEPKFWVRRAIDLFDGSLKIIKLVFHERFVIRVGDLSFECVRSPRKEARILDLIRGHRNFMQGTSVEDSAGNIIRIIDFIHGKTISDIVLELGKTHEEYFSVHFPAVLDDFIELVEAIRFLHLHGEKHGDIRRDHVIRDRQSGIYRWIDFDFNYEHREKVFGFDLFGLGNILSYLVGRGDVTTQDLKTGNFPAFDRLTTDDLNIIFTNRVVNLKKIYPYIPDCLNRTLLHFSCGTHIYYDNTDQLLDDLQEVRAAHIR